MMTRKLLALSLCTLVGACAGQQADTAAADPGAAAPADSTIAAIPEGFFALTPQLAVDDVDAALVFYGEALGAEVLSKLPGPDGRTFHAEMKIGDSIVFLDQAADGGLPSPKKLGGSPATLMVYVADANAAYAKAVGAGAQATMPLEDQFWGDRYGQLQDPYGHTWAVAQQIEIVTDEQMKQRSDLLMKEMAKMTDRAAEAPKADVHKGGADADYEPAWKSVEATPAQEPVPSDYHTVTIALNVPDANAAITFYEGAFGAVLENRMDMPNGKVMHAELKIGDSRLMLSDEMPEFGTRSAATLGGSPFIIHHYVADADAVFGKAQGMGVKVAYPIEDAAWGDRYGAVEDPTGIPWGIATRKENLSPEEIGERMKASMQGAEAAAAPQG